MSIDLVPAVYESLMPRRTLGFTRTTADQAAKQVESQARESKASVWSGQHDEPDLVLRFSDVDENQQRGPS